MNKIDQGALYKMVYAGREDAGAGVLYIGKGVVIGIDIGDVRYKGTYVVNESLIQVKINMTANSDGTLVTGSTFPRGTSIPITADLPNDFSNGSIQKILIAGQPVNVAFEKLDDIPS